MKSHNFEVQFKEALPYVWSSFTPFSESSLFLLHSCWEGGIRTAQNIKDTITEGNYIIFGGYILLSNTYYYIMCVIQETLNCNIYTAYRITLSPPEIQFDYCIAAQKWLIGRSEILINCLMNIGRSVTDVWSKHFF